jgi:hypothetical protein
MEKIIKIVRVDENGAIPIDQFSDLIDVSRVEYYEVIPGVKENMFTLKFYDKDEKPIKPKSKKVKKRGKAAA